jgi:hypothetical protein
MRRLVCAVAISMGMLLGCGGADAGQDPADALDTVEQGLACAYPDMTCPGTTICVDGDLCRQACPPSGICSSGRACRVSPGGTPYCL